MHSKNMAAASRSLKIGFILDDSLDKPDGVQQYVIAVGEWLRTQGHDIHYLVGQTSRTDIAGVHSLSKNLRMRFNGNRMSIPMPVSRRRMHQFLREQAFDVLHVQLPYSPWLAQKLILSADPATAILGTFHIAPNSGLVNIGTKALGIWTKRSLKRFDGIISVSTAAQSFAEETFHVATDVLPNVIDYQRFATAQPLSTYASKPLTILFLGRLVPRKGCALLLKALAELQMDTRVPDWQAVICGGGPLLAELQRYVAVHDLTSKVHFAGFIDETEKPRYYASADIAVFPSTGGESFGIVLIEAMASGHASVLAGDNPGYHSVMAPQPELLFNPKNTKQFADKIAHFLQDSVARSAAAAWGKSYAAQFDTSVIGQELVKRYDQALRKRRKP